jgi:poly-gamma-glutamate capsule biosynthesis protein CapA/YwtB (metallophosphatase superfamily)
MARVRSQRKVPSEAIAKFWDRYIQAVEKSDVPEYLRLRRWYVIRAKEYVGTGRDKPLRDQAPHDVSRYLEELGRKAKLKDWQFIQIVDAP